MFRYEGIILSVGGNGRSYILILEAGPLADTTQSKLYFSRFSTKAGFCRVSLLFLLVPPNYPHIFYFISILTSQDYM
jgi:hypothetical protein